MVPQPAVMPVSVGVWSRKTDHPEVELMRTRKSKQEGRKGGRKKERKRREGGREEGRQAGRQTNPKHVYKDRQPHIRYRTNLVEA